MCGIAGLLTTPGRCPLDGPINTMTDALWRRGPDARGVFVDPAAGLALGHRRLSIVDLSDAGAQPMTAASGRYVMVLNGEIYNFRDIRRELDAIRPTSWRGTSDTEVLLAAIEAWGLAGALAACEGMFALALWDRKERQLSLARDRIGEKPLFVARTADGLAFASQLGSIMAYPGFVGEDDERAIDQFLALSYIPEPLTPFLNVWKLPAGSFAVLKPGDQVIKPQAYWSAVDTAITARREAATGGDETAVIEQIEQRLQAVVRNQMLADVPLGAFLSGGIDSSLIVALMQTTSARPVRTFTIGFEDQLYDEAPYARAVAAHLGTDHTEVMVSWQDALGLVERLPESLDEPFADSSQLPTALVCQVARQHVTVALTGDGGDEVFGGYNRHRAAARLARLNATLPPSLRNALGASLERLSTSSALVTFEKAMAATGARNRIRLMGEKGSKLATALRSGDGLEMYLGLIRRDDGLAGRHVLAGTVQGPHAAMAAAGLDLAEQMMLLDSLTYLPGDILTKVDRASMAVSLETRVPFLDHRLFALAWQLPVSAKIKNGQTKHILRTMLARHVPPAMFERPKAGFGVPIAAWLRGPLKEWVAAHVADFKQASPRHASLASEAVRQFQDGSPTMHHLLWNIAMLQTWRQGTRQQMRPQMAQPPAAAPV
jgi:asparagine synthase (glutamine-hydrolysing)